jgi:exopolysaccharide biosynthesis polyprenyl glycosylphosphotransferase
MLPTTRGVANNREFSHAGGRLMGINMAALPGLPAFPACLEAPTFPIMLGRKQEINLQLSQLLDLALLVIAFFISYEIRAVWFADFILFSGDPVSDISNFYWMLAIIAPFTPLILEYFGYYGHPVQKQPWPWVSLKQMVKAAVVVVVVIGGFVIFARKVAESRAVLAVHGLVGGSMLLAKEAVIRARLRRKAKTEGWRERVIFAGRRDDLEQLITSLPRQQLEDMEIAARIDIEHQPVDDLVKALHDSSVERVIFAGTHLHFDRLQQAINACELEGVEAWLWTDFVKTSIARPSFDVLGGKPMLVFRSTPEASWAMMLKRVIDFAGALALITFPGIPLAIVAWIGIKTQSPGPVIFRQRRSGKNGRPFTMYKFRTMNIDAEAQKGDLEAHNKMSGPVFKIDNDPRIFPFGAWLRKTSIDEWPQLINVLHGEMSLVGPRPLPVYEVERISEAAQRRRLSVKPGLTCLWQVSGRNRITDFDEWVQLDLKYIDNWSIWLDLSILVRTLPAVFLGSGAK